MSLDGSAQIAPNGRYNIASGVHKAFVLFHNHGSSRSQLAPGHRGRIGLTAAVVQRASRCGSGSLRLSKPPPPLLGFNNNVRHRGRIFHIQTEDSGIRHARIMTHLFADGGRIVRTTRTEYSEHVGRADMVEVLRALMKEQHKSMFIRLRSGELDDAIADACGEHPEEAAPTKPDNPRPVPKATKSSPVQPQPSVETKASQSRGQPAQRARSSPPGERRLSNPALKRVVPSVPPPTGDLDLDVTSLDAHPPRVPRDADPRRAAALARPPSAPRLPSDLEAPEAPDRADADVRYAASRPAAIFAELPGPQNSIFGSEPISEQSLDDVILSYLADDLDGPSQE